MMKFRCFTATGERGPQVWLDLRKGAVAQRLLNALQDKELAKSGRFNINSLVKIDSGEFPVDGLANLGYSKSEIEAAIQGRIDAIAQEGEELEALRNLLHSSAWRGANGGPGSNQSREATMRRDWSNTLTGARKSASSEKLNMAQQMTKSRAMGATSAADIMMAHSFERAQGGHGFSEFHHGQHPGHVVQINDETEEWEHRKGAKVLGKSKRGASPRQAVSALNAHLSEFRGV